MLTKEEVADLNSLIERRIETALDQQRALLAHSDSRKALQDLLFHFTEKTEKRSNG